MAVKLRPADGEESDILGDHQPRVRRPGPRRTSSSCCAAHARPRDRPARHGEARRLPRRHPESQPAIQATLGAEPPASLAKLTYHSPHAFKLVDADGEGTWVRYRWRPEAGEADISRRRGPRARPRLPSRGARRAASRRPGRRSSCCSRSPPRTTRSTTPPPSGPTSASWSSPAGSSSPRSSTTPSPATTSTSSTRPGSSTGSSSPTTRSSTPAPGPTPSRPTAGLGVEVENPSTPPPKHSGALAPRADPRRAIITATRAVSSVGRAPRLTREEVAGSSPAPPIRETRAQGRSDVGRAGAGAIQGDRGRRAVPAPELEAAQGRAGRT